MDSITECRCGARIPDTWPKCAKCQSFARMDALEGGPELREERYWGARANWKRNQGVEPHIGPDLLAHIADEVSKRAQEESILAIRDASRLLAHHNLKARLFNMRNN